ncbi:MAG: rhomboid family intramembrane serine protease [Candidatus Dojkabacteria bacterium]
MFPLSDSHKTGKIPFITWGIIAANIAVFLYQLSLSNLDQFIGEYALTPALVNWSNITALLPFLTSMFMHGGFMHIISNMWFLAVFGDNTEARLGTTGYLLFYLVGGIVASLTQYFFSLGSMIPMLGASGAVAAVLGFYLIQFPGSQIRTLVFYYSRISIYNVGAQTMIGLWALTQLLNSIGSIGAVASGGVAWFAHLGGFIFGVAVGLLLKKRVNPPFVSRISY